MLVDVLGVDFDKLTMEESLDRAMENIHGGKNAMVCTPNPEIVWLARKNTALKEALAQAEFVLADGVGITLGAKILGRPLPARLPGIDFAGGLLERLAQEGKSVFLYGAKPGVAKQAAQNLEERYPGLQIAGTADGYGEDEPVIAQIQETRPDVLFVCLGAPRQELWMTRHREVLNVPLMAGLGGSLDVFSGTVKRAPPIFGRLGLEWLYRLAKNPRRIGRMLKLPLFLFAVIGQRLGLKNK